MDAWGFCISHETCIMSYAQVRWASPCNDVNAQCRSLWGKTTYLCVICLRLVGTACYFIVPKRCFEMLFDLLITLTHTSCVHTNMQLPFFARHDQMRIALPICAPTPAPFALTIKIVACPASVIVVTLLNLEKTAKSSLLIPFSFLL